MAHKIEIPLFAKETLLRQKCLMCYSFFTSENVVACGIKLHKDGKTYFYYESECPKCQNQAYTIFTSRPMDMKEFIQEMNKIVVSDKQEIIQENIKEKSKITDEEIENIRNALDKCNSPNDILFSIGLTEEQIDYFSKRDKEDESK